MSSPSDHDKNTQHDQDEHAVVALDELHYKSDACVLHEHVLFCVNDEYAGVHACEDDEPYALPQHSAALLIVML